MWPNIKKDSHISIKSLLFYVYNELDIIIQLMFYVEFVMWGIQYTVQIVIFFLCRVLFVKFLSYLW